MLSSKRYAAKVLVISLLTSCVSVTARAQPDAPRVQESNLVYLGSFGVPSLSPNGFDYGGLAPAYNPGNDSLYLVGHVYDMHTAEITIPGTGGTASIIQGLTDSLNGKLSSIGGEMRRIGGNLVYNNRLYVTAFIYFDASGEQKASHFSRPLSLSGGSVSGPSKAGPLKVGYYSGYMGLIPPEWQSRLGGPALTGNCCLSILSRTSYGPAAFAFDPENLGNAQTLLYYDQDHQTLGTYGAPGSHPEFNGTTRITGIVFPEGTSSVLFFGSTGVGQYCYGTGVECNDPGNGSKGEHALPYRAYVWAYDANDLEDVRSGSRQPWAVLPYAVWELSELGNVGYDFAIGGAAYDPSTGRIYVSRLYGDDARPRIYVFEVDNSVLSLVPEPPTALSAE